MGIFDWFRRVAAGDEASADAGAGSDNPSEGEDQQNATIGGLNFMTAIDAHMKWKTRLENYIQGNSDEELRPEIVGRDDKCALGEWIHGQGAKDFGELDAFGDMRSQHAHFHTCAANIVRAAQLGRSAEASDMLQRGDYVRASERVKMLLARLYVQIAERK